MISAIKSEYEIFHWLIDLTPKLFKFQKVEHLERICCVAFCTSCIFSSPLWRQTFESESHPIVSACQEIYWILANNVSYLCPS